jgi:tryptophan-rich hypothetical protein
MNRAMTLPSRGRVWIVLLILGNSLEISSAWTATSSFRMERPVAMEESFSSPSPQQRSVLIMGLRGKKIRREKRRALQDPTPARIQTPYGAIRLSRPPRLCECCRGRGLLRCQVCLGQGVIRATGPRKTNVLMTNRLIGSKWTSVEIRNGHRQHTIVETRGSSKKGNLECRVINCCGDQKDSWIPVNDLKDKMVWRMGWQTLDDILRADRGPLLDARFCFRCKGDKVLKCVDCDGKGNIPSYEPLYD